MLLLKLSLDTYRCTSSCHRPLLQINKYNMCLTVINATFKILILATPRLLTRRKTPTQQAAVEQQCLNRYCVIHNTYNSARDSSASWAYVGCEKETTGNVHASLVNAIALNKLVWASWVHPGWCVQCTGLAGVGVLPVEGASYIVSAAPVTHKGVRILKPKSWLS